MPHQIKLTARFSDCDAFSHVNNAKYLTYAEQSRISYFDDVLGKDIDWKEKGFILAKAEVNFIKPILFKDEVIIESNCTRIGNKSINVFYAIFKERSDGTRIDYANGDTVLVAYNYNKLETIPVPIVWREKLVAFEGAI